MTMKIDFRTLLKGEDGTSAVEYGLMAGLVASMVVALISLRGGLVALLAAFAG
jgi:Flp pilus assembly pilin Flp